MTGSSRAGRIWREGPVLAVPSSPAMSRPIKELTRWILVWALTVTSAPTMASIFFGWQVTDVPSGDLLSVRAYPSFQSRTLVGHSNRTPLSLTGRCQNLHLNRVAGQPEWRQRQAVWNTWCEVWLDPTGSGRFRASWVYGRYLRPL